MDLLRIAPIGLATMLAALAGCDGHREPPAPTIHAAAGGDGLTPLPPPVLGAGTEAAPGDGDDKAAAERPHKRGGGAFGVGIRPSAGASGIVP